jgi:hypothetical protein
MVVGRVEKRKRHPGFDRFAVRQPGSECISRVAGRRIVPVTPACDVVFVQCMDGQPARMVAVTVRRLPIPKRYSDP